MSYFRKTRMTNIVLASGFTYEGIVHLVGVPESENRLGAFLKKMRTGMASPFLYGLDFYVDQSRRTQPAL